MQYQTYTPLNSWIIPEAAAIYVIAIKLIYLLATFSTKLPHKNLNVMMQNSLDSYLSKGNWKCF